MAAKLGKVVTCYKKFQPIKSHNPLMVNPLRSRDKLKTFYLHYHNIKPGSVVTYNKELPSINSHDSFITWSS